MPGRTGSDRLVSGRSSVRSRPPAPRLTSAVAQPPVLVAAIYDVLPLEARLDRVALIDSATGELWPVSASP